MTLRVGIDGPDGAGKTTFADALAAELTSRGRTVIRLSVDDFHNSSTMRYRRGKDNPEGFWLDAFDYDRLISDVLEPLGPSGDGRYRDRAHDLQSDSVLDPAWQAADPQSIVIVDGLFLHRDELAHYWDFSVYLDVPFDITAQRLANRDGSPADLDHPALRRYVEAQRIYLRRCNPKARATLVLDNS